MAKQYHVAGPENLHKAGAAFHAAILERYDITAVDAAVLLELARCIDELESLQEAIEEFGTMTVGAAGQPVLNPALRQLNEHRASFDKLLVRLALPDENGQVPKTAIERRGAAGAAARWRNNAGIGRPGSA